MSRATDTRRKLLSGLGGFAAAGSIAAHLPNRVEAQGGPNGGKCAPPQQFRYSYTAYAFNPCPGEFVRITVDIKQSVQTCLQSDGTVIYRIHTTTHGSGNGIDPVTDTSTGTSYILNAQDRKREVWAAPDGGSQFVFTSVERYRQRLIAKGASPNSALTTTTTFTVDASGNVSFNDTFDIDCRG